MPLYTGDNVNGDLIPQLMPVIRVSAAAEDMRLEWPDPGMILD